jgi:hypothetical protein
MRVNYYILRNGILRRKQNTVYFVYKPDGEKPKGEERIVEAEPDFKLDLITGVKCTENHLLTLINNYVWGWSRSNEREVD